VGREQDNGGVWPLPRCFGTSYWEPALGIRFTQHRLNDSRAIDLCYIDEGNFVVSANAGAMYVVRKEVRDKNSPPELLPGQAWGRRGDRKLELPGDDIHQRFREILERNEWSWLLAATGYSLETPPSQLRPPLSVRLMNFLYPLYLDCRHWLKSNTPIARIDDRNSSVLAVSLPKER